MNKIRNLRILVVEDDAIVAQDIVDCLRELGHCPIGPAYDLLAAKELLCDNTVQIALLDIHLEGRDDGILLSSWIRQEYFIPVIFLTAYSDYVTLSKVKQVYPEHFLVKPFNPAQLKAAIEITANNFYNSDPQYEANIKALRLNQHVDNVLTKREIDVLLLICQGLSNLQISQALFVSENTVKTHLKNIFSKTASSSRTDLMGKLNQF